MVGFLKKSLSGELGVAKSFWILVIGVGVGLNVILYLVISPIAFTQGIRIATYANGLSIAWFAFAAYSTVRAAFLHGRPSGWGWLALSVVFLMSCNAIYTQYVANFSTPTWDQVVARMVIQRATLPQTMNETGLILEEIETNDEAHSLLFRYRLPDTNSDSFKDNNSERAVQWKAEFIATYCPFETEYLGNPTNELTAIYIAQDESELSVTIYPEDCGL